jgi:hypothetical protein
VFDHEHQAHCDQALQRTQEKRKRWDKDRLCRGLRSCLLAFSTNRSTFFSLLTHKLKKNKCVKRWEKWPVSDDTRVMSSWTSKLETHALGIWKRFSSSIRTHFDPAVILLSLGDPKEKRTWSSVRVRTYKLDRLRSFSFFCWSHSRERRLWKRTVSWERESADAGPKGHSLSHN